MTLIVFPGFFLLSGHYAPARQRLRERVPLFLLKSFGWHVDEVRILSLEVDKVLKTG